MKNFNSNRWFFIIGTPVLIGAIASVLAVSAAPPEVKCMVWKSDICSPVPMLDTELVIQNETGEGLPGVTVQVIAVGPPEITTTDDNGYAQVKIPSKGNVRVSMTKAGYETKTLTINLENDSNTTRVTRLSKQENETVKPEPPVIIRTSQNPPDITQTPKELPLENPKVVTGKKTIIDDPKKINSPTKTEERVSPEEMVKKHYIALNKRQYQETWNNLSPYFQKLSGSSNAYGDYTEWWDSVERINIGQVTVVSQSNTQATVDAELEYVYKTGKIATDKKNRIKLIWDDNAHKWLINEKVKP